MPLNEQKFLENVRKVLLKPEETQIYSKISNTKVREKLEKFITQSLVTLTDQHY
jgi:vancomycin resistance protein YoaR